MHDPYFSCSLSQYLNTIHYHGRCFFSESAKSCFYDTNIVFQCQFYIYNAKNSKFTLNQVNIYRSETIAISAFYTLKDGQTFMQWKFKMLQKYLFHILFPIHVYQYGLQDIFQCKSQAKNIKTAVIQFCSICIVWSWFCGFFNPEGYAQKHSRINPKSLTSCVHNKSFTRKKLCKRLMIKIYILYSSKQLILDKNHFRLFW